MFKKNFDIALITNNPGRGTLRSMPIHFSRDANIGAAHVSFPLTLTKARALTPALELNYHANQGNGVFGIGFNLSGVLNIIRSTHQGGVPRYDDEDIFILSNVGELVRISDSDEKEIIRYRPRLDTQCSLIEYYVADQYWLIKEANGINHRLGNNTDGQVSHELRGIYQWWVSETFDVHGNKIHYTYGKKLINNAVSFYLMHIKYGHYRDENEIEKFAFCCTLDYGHDDAKEKNAKGESLWKKFINDRADQFTHYRAGFAIATTELCQRILLYHTLEEKELLVKYWSLEYQVNAPLSLMESIQEIGCRSNSKNEYIIKALPPARFDFFSLNEKPVDMELFDLGRDMKFPGQAGTYQWVDLYRDGLPGILYSDEFTAWYWRSEGKGQFSSPKIVSPFPNDMDFSSSFCRLIHLGNEKKTALMISDKINTGYYLLDEEKIRIEDDQYKVSFSPYCYFRQTPSALTDPDSEILDLTGTGKSDVAIFDAIFPYYHPASDDVSEGYTRPKSLTLPKDFPRNQYDVNAHIGFEDIFGDGLLHRVKVSCDGIDVWPNIGHGRFESKIHWDLPILPGTFNPACVFFTDIDGSGACDFVYATKKKLLIFLNHGQGFSSDPTHTLIFPEGYTYNDQLLFGDLLGSGFSGVIFIKRDVKQNRYYSASFAPVKPYLLREMKSSTGIITTFTYGTSITSYLEDRNNNKLASLRLPFALPVLSEMTVKDPITQVTIEKSYKYHYGEYDFIERTFCGFAYVEATRHEYIAQKFNNAKESYVQPIQKAFTKSWYYNRTIDEALTTFPRYDPTAFTNKDIYQHYFKKNESTEGVLLKNSQDMKSDANLSRETQFALHGYALGYEIWGKGSDYFGENFNADAPLHVQINQYNVRCDKTPDSQHQHGIFVVQSRENYRFVYEQQESVPRISREINLVFDDKNRVLVNAKLDYGRDTPMTENLMDDIVLDASIVDKLKKLQNKTDALSHHMTYASVTSSSDFQYLHLLSEQKTFDLSGDNLSAQTFFDIKTLSQNSTRLIQHYQQYYWDDAQTIVSPLGISGRFALIHHQCSLLGTHDQVKAWYTPLLKTTGNETVESVLIENGYFSEKNAFDELTQWWKPDVIHHYGDASQYYQLTEIKLEYNGYSNQSSLFQRTTIHRDSYQLAVIQVNKFLTPEKFFVAKFETDYQSIKPYRIIDHNENIHLMLYDPLCQLMAETKYGQLQGEWIGNLITIDDSSIPISTVQLSDLSFAMSQQFENMTVDKINENNSDLLGSWLSVYYHHYSIDEQQPRYTIVLTQPQHQKRALPILTEISKIPICMTIYYVDGFDNPLQTKQRTDEADPNKCWLSSGLEIHSRTGKKLRKLLPTFSEVAQYDFGEMIMDPNQALANEYDAAGELLQQTLPNGDQRRLLRSTWYEIYYDQNAMYNKRHGTNTYSSSTIIDFKDAAGRVTGHLKIAPENTGDRYQFSHSIFDVLGRPIAHQDARLSVPNLTITYDLLGQKVSHTSVDRGQETFLYHYQGTRTRRRVGDWSYQTELDSWQRSLQLNVYSNTQAPVSIETWQYGEMLENPQEINACGEVTQFANEKSIFRQKVFGMDGHCIQSSRTILLPPVTFNIQEILKDNGMPCPFFDDTKPTLEGWKIETFDFKREYNVSGCLIAESLPNGQLTVHEYNALAQLTTLKAGKATALFSVVSNMKYQEAGLRTTCQLGTQLTHGITITYDYDAKTQRLLSVKGFDANNPLLQDQSYTFDPVGNIINLQSKARQLQTSASNVLSIPSSIQHYQYDDYYRLISADGLEMTNKPISSDAKVIPQQYFSENPTVQTYQQLFTYDNGDNLNRIKHVSAQPWQLDFSIQAESNQFATLTSTKDNHPVDLKGKALYDASGNMQKLDETTDLTWDHTNQLSQTTVDRSATSEGQVKEYYGYRGTAFQDVPFSDNPGDRVAYSPGFFGSSRAAKHPAIDPKPFAEYGNRLYKITCFEKSDNSLEIIEQIFLGSYERKRIFTIADKTNIVPVNTLIRHTVHLHDDDVMMATHHQFELDINAREASQAVAKGVTPIEQWQYHLTNHLKSSVLSLDDQGNVLSFEGYQAYGQLGFIMTRDAKQLSLQDYHYSSEIRDQVTGLYYYGARSYAPQFGRWLSPDPAGFVDGTNLYAYVRNNPIKFIDPTGMASKSPYRHFLKLASMEQNGIYRKDFDLRSVKKTFHLGKARVFNRKGTEPNEKTRRFANSQERIPNHLSIEFYVGNIAGGTPAPAQNPPGVISKRDGKSRVGYDAGHILPGQVGGSGTDCSNIAAQNPQMNRGHEGHYDAWRGPENKFASEVRDPSNQEKTAIYLHVQHFL